MIYKAAFNADGGSLIEGVNMLDGLSTRFTEKDDLRILNPYAFGGLDRISGVCYCKENGGLYPTGPVFDCSDELYFDNRWSICMIRQT